jgi:Domain of unknown function (DUF222)/HNH endonuclease
MSVVASRLEQAIDSLKEVSRVSTVPSPASTDDAVKMVLAGMRFIRANATEMVTEEQAQCLQALEQVNSVSTATRAVVLTRFISTQGYSADADYSPRSWLIHRTRITKGAATAHTAWARRADAHPLIADALAEGHVLSESYGRKLCEWTDKLPEDCRPAADAILVTAARAGADQQDLVELAMEIYARSLPASPEDDPDDGFEDRQVRVETTFAGAGVMTGDLTAECAAIVTAVLDALSAPMDAEDTRTHGQRYHDALQESMKRLLASGLLPERAGQPVKANVHVSLLELRALDHGSVLETQWVTEVRIRWAARRAAASEGASDGAAWLDGDAAQAATCDATLTPVVTGDLDLPVLDDLVKLCVELDRLDHGAQAPAPASPSAEALQQAIIGKAIDLLSGPGGLASFLRTRQLGARLAGPSLPLDIGFSKTIPPGIRNAVILRDRRCRWPGGCNQPARACEVHHVKHIAHGGPTSLKECVLLCSYHHQIVIHRWGWTLVLNPDGTTTAWNPDRTKVLHSHSPPTARAG